MQLLGVGNLIIRSLSFRGFQNSFSYVAGMLAMSAGTGQQHCTCAPGGNSPGVSAANTFALGSGISSNAAGAHHAEAAAGTLVTKLALRLLGNSPVKRRNDAFFLCLFNHFQYSRVTGAFNVLRVKYSGSI